MSHKTGEAAVTRLQTDERVLARVTDGIYRLPSAALRELISNAYDADATSVFIDTDAPRFSTIRISDNGNGMDEVALSRLIHHIGGSSKRTAEGQSVGTTDEKDSNLSPKGRRLIGKIGIGLFSVSQLTSQFQIITKKKGSPFRLVADIQLRKYSEESQEQANVLFESGTVRVTQIDADDSEAHGTEIILLDVSTRVRDILRSKDRWEEILSEENAQASPQTKLSAPNFHSGFMRIGSTTDAEYEVEPSLPWLQSDSPTEKFEKLFNRVVDLANTTKERPDLETVLDGYLGTLWALSVSAPLPYVEKHPFDITSEDEVDVFKIVNNRRGKSDRVELKSGQTVRDALNLKEGSSDPAGAFNVYIDEVELKRPITFRKFARGNREQRPMLFVGSYRPDLSKIPAAFKGGDLEFEAYLFWNQKIVPKENNGIIVRVNGASGALFDDTFMKYQVSEQTRLRQITSEVFVEQGMDAALNIDRESFNFGHPHYQILTQWTHRALRQLANTHKGIGDEIRERIRTEQRAATASKLERLAEDKWLKLRGSSDSFPPEATVASTADASRLRSEGLLAVVLEEIPSLEKGGRKELDSRMARARALAVVLDAYGILETMDYSRQSSLIDSIMEIFYEEAK
ncbi:ATP-binding protein [Stenotrophomonas maltophilia]|uniref:ATP-binding protein n=1 Tax=Stenotrophomonas TaxID=40323 RepID=UPI0021C802DE|nr:ATP-binding protein [Stenotrophomonas muris]MCU1119749.1 ATP-binding protein [Stenotrophomonas maltophilia]MCU1133067.1 ATP-binding protein [Stenotrophomonas maltophilia]